MGMIQPTVWTLPAYVKRMARNLTKLQERISVAVRDMDKCPTGNPAGERDPVRSGTVHSTSAA